MLSSCNSREANHCSMLGPGPWPPNLVQYYSVSSRGRGSDNKTTGTEFESKDQPVLVISRAYTQEEIWEVEVSSFSKGVGGRSRQG